MGFPPVTFPRLREALIFAVLFVGLFVGLFVLFVLFVFVFFVLLRVWAGLCTLLMDGTCRAGKRPQQLRHTGGLAPHPCAARGWRPPSFTKVLKAQLLQGVDIVETMASSRSVGRLCCERGSASDRGPSPPPERGPRGRGRSAEPEQVSVSASGVASSTPLMRPRGAGFERSRSPGDASHSCPWFGAKPSLGLTQRGGGRLIPCQP